MGRHAGRRHRATDRPPGTGDALRRALSDGAEFYRARAAITRRLVERHGFTIVALEADWPDAARLDAAPDGEAPFDAQQNARVVTAAERYDRATWRSGTESWNLRDRHMFETLRSLPDRGSPEARAVVLAHNSHVGNTAATETGWGSQFNIGELCRTAFGAEAGLIGFGTDRGTVACASHWGGGVEVQAVRRALLDLRRPETERRSHWFEAVLPDQFDAFARFAETRAVTPLDPPPEETMP